MDEFKDSTTSLIADVDCTTGGKSLCEKHGISGYPSIKHGDPDDLQDYNGGRDFAALKKFAEENLGPTCSPDNIDLCSDENKALIEQFQKMTPDELKAAMADSDKKVEKLESQSKKKVDGFQKQIDDMQKSIEAANKKKDDEVNAKSKKLGLRMMKAVASAKKKKDEM